MDALGGQQRLQTLGERLLSLVPGDSCPCCGGSLSAPAPAGAVRMSSAPVPVDAATGEMLVCRKCGCELDAAEAPCSTNARQALSAAA
jgi:hypothetical protein